MLMLHGGFHTGQAFIETPDGRPGWAQAFTDAGHDVYVPDWPAHGESPGRVGLQNLSTRDVAVAIAAVLQAVGPAVILAHSAGGPIAWWLAEQLPAKVSAIIGVAPGPPANLVPELPDDPGYIATLALDQSAGCPVYSPLGKPVVPSIEFIRAFWASSPRFPMSAFDRYAVTVVPESPVILNERFNIGGRGLSVQDPARVAERPILVITGEHDARHPREADERVANYFGADFIWLPDRGIRDNGHMLMLEDNHDAIAHILIDWLHSQALTP